MYWDIRIPQSYNCLFNFIVGARGVGKTYGCKKAAIIKFLKSGKQFVYVRRFEKELKKCNKFFDDISVEFPDHEFSVSKRTFIIDGKEAGTALALSTSKIEKSTPFPNVDTIIFDEFILDKGYHHYLPDEVTNFLELYSTVARMRDVKVWFISNALTMTNPYFLYFNIKMPYGKDIAAKDDILIQVIQNEEYAQEAASTRFGKIIAGTQYANYAFDNKFLRDDFTFIEKKTGKSRYQYAIKFKGEIYGVWIDYEVGKQFISKDYDKNGKIVFTLVMDDHTPNTMLLKGNKTLISVLLNNYKNGLVRFESINIKNMMLEVIKMTL